MLLFLYIIFGGTIQTTRLGRFVIWALDAKNVLLIGDLETLRSCHPAVAQNPFYFDADRSIGTKQPNKSFLFLLFKKECLSS